MEIHIKSILWFGKTMLLMCDGNCSKAWGISHRPRVSIGNDDDDIEFLADDELGVAPENPNTYEGGDGKPSSPHQMNKWCSRECERSVVDYIKQEITLPDWSERVQNQPWKHTKE